jgi:hypothetical protein
MVCNKYDFENVQLPRVIQSSHEWNVLRSYGVVWAYMAYMQCRICLVNTRLLVVIDYEKFKQTRKNAGICIFWRKILDFKLGHRQNQVWCQVFGLSVLIVAVDLRPAINVVKQASIRLSKMLEYEFIRVQSPPESGLELMCWKMAESTQLLFAQKFIG